MQKLLEQFNQSKKTDTTAEKAPPSPKIFEHIEQPEPMKPPLPIKSPLPSTPQVPAPQPVIQPGKVFETPSESNPKIPAPPVFKQPEPQLSFFDRYPNLEKFIGENLVSKIGIAILVLAIGFFVKYAIDNNWIGPIGRVGIGVLCGGILIGIAHWLRNTYRAFSSVLVGGGIAVLYFTITLAFKASVLLPTPPF